MAVNKVQPEKAGPVKKEIAKNKKDSEEKQIKVKLVKSLIGHPQKQRKVAKGLGLRKINSEVIRRDCPEIWGMIKKIEHLVRVEAVDRK